MRTDAEDADQSRTIGQHDRLIADILSDYPEARTKGFMQTVRALPGADYMRWMASNEPDYFINTAMVPDAFMVDGKTILVFEAVHRHEITPHKFARICDLAFALDEDEYQLLLIRVDAYDRVVFEPRAAYMAHVADSVRRGSDVDEQEIAGWLFYSAERCFERRDIANGIALMGIEKPDLAKHERRHFGHLRLSQTEVS